jgi:hypothetical protein
MFNEKIPSSLLPFSYESVSEDHGFFLFNFSIARLKKNFKINYIDNEKNPSSLLTLSYENGSEDRAFFSFNFLIARIFKIYLY